MKLILVTICAFVFGCSARPSISVDQLQQIQQEIEQLKRSNTENIAALKQSYDEKIRTYGENISSLEKQLRLGKKFVQQTGLVYSHLYISEYWNNSH